MKKPFYDRLLYKIKNNKLIAILLVVFAVVSALIPVFEKIRVALLEERSKAAEIVLSQFAINETDSYFAVDSVYDAQKPFSCGFGIRPSEINLRALGINQNKLVLIRHTQQGAFLSSVFADVHLGYSLENAIRMNDDYLSDLSDNIKKRWIADAKSPMDNSKTYTGIFPVFDMTFLNKSKNAGVLTTLIINGYMFLEGGDSYENKNTIEPLGVSYRYLIDLNKYKKSLDDAVYDKLVGSLCPAAHLSGEINLVPPIRVEGDKAIRIQVQLIDSGLDVNKQLYILNWSFGFSNGNTVSSEYVAFIHSH